MKIILKVFILVFCLEAMLFANTNLENEKARQAAIALNYIHASLNKIVIHNDKVVLEEEYDNIINNIRLSKIDDVEIVDAITSIMNTLTKFKLSNMEKKQLKDEYEIQLENLMTNSLINSTQSINPLAIITNPSTTILNFRNAYMTYKQSQEKLKKGLEKSQFKLEANALTDLNEARKEFIKVYWKIMKRYDMPDKWRITEKQFTRFIRVLKDEDDEKKYRQLERMKNEMEILPTYWYELSLIARKINDKEIELKAIKKYEELNDQLLRSNPFYSLLLANKTTYLDISNEKETITKILKKIYEIDSLNANRKIFSAMKYIQLEEYTQADNLLTQNIDDDFLVVFSQRLKAEIYLKNDQDNQYEIVINKLLNNQNIAASEYLYYLDKKPIKLLLEEIDQEIKTIKIVPEKTIYGKDNLSVSLPKKWVLKDVEDTELNLIVGDEEHKFSKISIEKDFINYRYKNSISLKDFIDMKTTFIKLKLKHKLVPIEIIYEVKIKKEEKKLIDNNTDTKKENSIFNIDIKDVANKAKEYTKPLANSVDEIQEYLEAELIFVPKQILTISKCFDIENTMRRCQNNHSN